jgi:hypothetical protein
MDHRTLATTASKPPLEPLPKVSSPTPNDRAVPMLAGGLRIQPSPFNQRVDPNSIAWAVIEP